MKQPTSHDLAFVSALRRISARDDRAALAALRSGLGRAAGDAPAMHRYVLPWVPSHASPREEEAYYLLASLFAWHPQDIAPGAGENLGASAARLVAAHHATREGVERRFAALLGSHRDDVPAHLRHFVALLRTGAVAVCWAQLLADLRAWDWEDSPAQRSWARSFWRAIPSDGNAPESNPEAQGESHVS